VDGKLKSERGFALVITLLIAALLVALTVEFVNEVFVDTSARQNFTDGQQASIMAGSGVDLAIKGLKLSLAGRTYNSLADPWAKPFKQEDEKGTLSIIIEDESGKLNINQIFGANGNILYQRNYDITSRLLKKLGVSPDLLDSLADWVDNNEEPHPAGAESSYYKTLKPPYGAKNANLDTVEELALVKGFEAKVMQLLRPYVTIYTEMPGAININTASREIIAALDDKMTDSLTNQVLDYRKKTPFQIPADLAKVAGMETIATGLTTSTTTIGTVYRIISLATVRETTRVVEAVVRISDGHILYWREY
jgi:general secretion pathway protein K